MRLVRTLGICLVFGSCGGREISLDVGIPDELVEFTTWFEVAAYKDAKCSAVGRMLTDGTPEGATARVAFRRDARSSGRFGDIPNGRYAFAAVARSDDCTVLASGCTEEDVGDTKKVFVRLTPIDAPTGTCPSGAACQAAKCVPANDNSDPSVGARCSLELLGAGPLLNPIHGAGTWMSAPAIAPTSGGFVIVYREVDPNGQSARIVLLPIDSSGGALPAETPGLPDHCEEETDGVGLVMSGDDGMIALARAPCRGKPALELLNFKATIDDEGYRLTRGAYRVSTDDSDHPVVLGPARSTAPRANGGLVAFTQRGVGHVATMDPERGIVAPQGSFGGPNVAQTWIATSERVLALLAVGRSPSPLGDAGADEPLDPINESSLRLLVLPSDTNVETLDSEANSPRAPMTFNGLWGSLAAFGGRVIVLSYGSSSSGTSASPGHSVSYRTFDLNSNPESPPPPNGFAVEGTGPVTAGDVTVVGNRAFFAVLKPGAVELHVYGNASTTLTPLSNVSFARETRISAINTIRDGQIAVTATQSRVAVVWTTAKELGPSDRAGGYAVFACTD